MSGRVKKAQRLLATIAHLTLRQVAVRATVVGRRKWWRLRGATAGSSGGAALRAGVRSHWTSRVGEVARRGECSAQRADAGEVCAAALDRRFTFLGQTCQYGHGIYWHDPEVSQLWRYHLHYFGWVPALLLVDQERATSSGFHAFREQALSWIAANARLVGDGWHPYTLSLRTVNWLKACAGWRRELEDDPDFRQTLLASLHAQVRKLEKQLEFDVRGNHLMENARALCWAGLFFEGRDADRWAKRAEDILAVEIPEQILADGAHFERTPGYHTTMLALLLELAVLRIRNEQTVPQPWLSAIHRMAHFLAAIVAPDGRLPLIKDTTYDAAADTAELLHIAAAVTGDVLLRPPEAPSLWAELVTDGLPVTGIQVERRATPDVRASGFFVTRGQSGDFLFADCGQPCPDYLPAHAHADALSYEFHAAGEPLIVDSGVYQYAPGMWRDYFRSTRAHNTVEVDRQNSSDVWASFRVARRARVTAKASGETKGITYLIGEHDGYRHLRQLVTHRRCFLWSDREFLIVLDALAGNGAAQLSSYIHFHPSVAVSHRHDHVALNNGHELVLRTINAPLPAEMRGAMTPEPQGWYSERFGERVENTVLMVDGSGSLPQLFGYVISPYREISATAVRADGGVQIAIKAALAEISLRWRLSEGTISA